MLNLSLKVEMPRSVVFFDANKGYAQFQLKKNEFNERNRKTER